MSTRHNNEMVIHHYHSALEFISHLKFMSSRDLSILRERFKVAAAREADADSLSLRMLGNICEAYLLEALNDEAGSSALSHGA